MIHFCEKSKNIRECGAVCGCIVSRQQNLVDADVSRAGAVQNVLKYFLPSSYFGLQDSGLIIRRAPLLTHLMSVIIWIVAESTITDPYTYRQWRTRPVGIGVGTGGGGSRGDARPPALKTYDTAPSFF